MAAWTDKDICEAADAAEEKRKAIQPEIDQCMVYGMPWRRDPKKGRVRFDQLFDSTGPQSVQSFSKRIASALTPAFQRWIELKAGPVTPPDMVEAINRQLADVTAIILAAIDASNFQIKSEEMYADLSTGTGAMLILEGDDENPLIFHSVPPWALGIEEGPSGTIENVYWCRPYEYGKLKRHWPEAKWPKPVLDKIEAAPREKVEILQASYFDPADKVFRFHVMVKGEGADGGRVTVWSREERTNPWIVPRWWTTSGDPWGRGPLMLALADIKTANKVVEMILKAAAYSLAPPLMVLHDGVVNPDTLRLAPNALIKVARTGGPMGASLAPMDIGSRVDLAQLVLEDLRGNIRAPMLAKQLPPVTGAVRSPTEIIERLRDFAFEQGSSFGRLNHEYVPKLIARVIDVLDRKKIPLIKWDELKIDQLTMKVQVVSPLAQSQSMEDVQSAVRWAELVKGLFGEEAFALAIPIEDAPQNLGDAMGVPNYMRRPKADRDLLQKAAGQAAAGQAAAAQAARASAEAVPDAPVQTGQPLRLVAPQ
jgi:hypothetical protein